MKNKHQHMCEHILAKNYHWDLETIREMNFYDFKVHLMISTSRCSSCGCDCSGCGCRSGCCRKCGCCKK